MFLTSHVHGLYYTLAIIRCYRQKSTIAIKATDLSCTCSEHTFEGYYYLWVQILADLKGSRY